MIRHAARQFTGWKLLAGPEGWLAQAECPECPAIIASDGAELPEWLDAILDHEWEHTPEAGSAPVTRIDRVLTTALDDAA